jgi:hypothetical protein
VGCVAQGGSYVRHKAQVAQREAGQAQGVGVEASRFLNNGLVRPSEGAHLAGRSVESITVRKKMSRVEFLKLQKDYSFSNTIVTPLVLVSLIIHS